MAVPLRLARSFIPKAPRQSKSQLQISAPVLKSQQSTPIRSIYPLPPSARSSTHAQARSIAHITRLAQAQVYRYYSTTSASPKSPNAANTSNQQQEMDPFGGKKLSWKELGANKTVKWVVIIFISIIGTMESIFWIKVIWAKFFATEEEVAEANSDADKK